MKLSRKLLFFPALAVGILILVVAVKLRPDLPVKPAISKALLVETVVLVKQPIAPLVVGFGNVEPKFDWKAIAEVSGKVVYRHPGLEKGRMLLAGSEILRIDPLDYQLVLAKREADLGSSRTQLARLALEEKNLNSTLSIELNRLSLSRKELERKQNLQKRGLTSQSDVDQQRQTTLSQQKLVTELQNQLSLYPDQRKVSEAQVRVNESQVEEARRALAKTRIVLPEDMRISAVNVELDQVVNLQQSMVEAHRTDVMEVEAQLSIHDMRLLAATVGVFSRDDSGMPTPAGAELKAQVELSSGTMRARWPAVVSRISDSVDASQATAGVILEMQQDMRALEPATAPPLVSGMFVKAEIEGKASAHWVIPERALHGDKIYINSPDNTLQIRTVEVLFRRDNQVVVRGDLVEGEKLILNDLLPAIEGMLLRETGQPILQNAEPDTGSEEAA
jgi:multidrug efflux pump subunit AcrA (membrane-fusion protein)